MGTGLACRDGVMSPTVVADPVGSITVGYVFGKALLVDRTCGANRKEAIMRDDLRLCSLVEAADEAYQEMRRDVINDLPSRTTPENACLTGRQQRTVDRFHNAEQALADYRHVSYGHGVPTLAS
jgi:hypothetical protein